ncbi:hypothetical protein WG915_03535 [Corynebacterium sp. H128]
MTELSIAVSSDVAVLVQPIAAVMNFLEPFAKIASAASKLFGLLP